MSVALLASGESMKMVVREPALLHQPDKVGHHFLGALDREGGDEKGALAGRGGVHFSAISSRRFSSERSKRSVPP